MHPQVKQELDNVARAQQMKINARLAALQVVQDILKAPHYNDKVDAITAIAMAMEIEQYILGNIEEESQAAIDKAKSMANVRPIMRP